MALLATYYYPLVGSSVSLARRYVADDDADLPTSEVPDGSDGVVITVTHISYWLWDGAEWKMLAEVEL